MYLESRSLICESERESHKFGGISSPQRAPQRERERVSSITSEIVSITKKTSKPASLPSNFHSLFPAPFITTLCDYSRFPPTVPLPSPRPPRFFALLRRADLNSILRRDIPGVRASKRESLIRTSWWILNECKRLDTYAEWSLWKLEACVSKEREGGKGKTERERREKMQPCIISRTGLASARFISTLV